MRIMTLPETDGEESCLAFVSGNFFRSLRCSSVSHSRNGWIVFCLLVKESCAMLHHSKPFVSGS